MDIDELNQPEKSNTKIRYLSQLDQFVSENGIDYTDICLVGSTLLADYNLRDNNDIDVVIHPKKRGKVDLQKTPNQIELPIEKYSWLDITDRDLVSDDRYHYKSNGYKIVKPEIELSFKHRRLWEKDRKDIKILEQRFINGRDYNWNWDLFSYEYYPDKFTSRGLPETKSQSSSILCDFEKSIQNEGVYSTLKKSVRYVDRHSPFSLFSKDYTAIKANKTKFADNHLYFVVWPTASEFHDAIVDRLDTDLGVISTKEVDLNNSLDEFIHDVYNHNKTERLIEYKSYKISSDGSTILVVKTHPPSNQTRVSNTQYLSEFKNQIRKQYYPYVGKDSFHNIIHGPDSFDENEWIKTVLRQYNVLSN